MGEGLESVPLLGIQTQRSAGGPAHTALFEGRLAGRAIDAKTADLWVVGPTGERIEVTWPSAFRARSNPLRLVNPDGHDVAKAGQNIFLGGGFVAGANRFSAHKVSVDNPLHQRPQ